jgi:hypothetical protein
MSEQAQKVKHKKLPVVGAGTLLQQRSMWRSLSTMTMRPPSLSTRARRENCALPFEIIEGLNVGEEGESAGSQE